MSAVRILVISPVESRAQQIIATIGLHMVCEATLVNPLDEQPDLTGCDVAILVHDHWNEWIQPLVESRHEKTPDVALVVADLPQQRSSLVRYLMMGIHGFTFAEDTLSSLHDVILSVGRGEWLLSPEAAGLVLDELHSMHKEIGQEGHFNFHSLPDGSLSPREEQVLELIALEGLTNPQIAERLYLEVGTVKNHVHRILSKLDVRNRQDAARFYFARKITDESRL